MTIRRADLPPCQVALASEDVWPRVRFVGLESSQNELQNRAKPQRVPRRNFVRGLPFVQPTDALRSIVKQQRVTC